MENTARQFETTLQAASNGGVFLEVPFDPAEAWGVKERHHVTGSVNGFSIRGPLTQDDGGWRLSLGPTTAISMTCRPSSALGTHAPRRMS